MYFNLDNGTGKIRGIYTRATPRRADLPPWLAALDDLDAHDDHLANTGGTDHESFDRAGLPGFQFIQDPMDYSADLAHPPGHLRPSQAGRPHAGRRA